LGRYILAKRDRDRTTDDFETQVLSWTQRSLALHQIDGEHVVPFLGNLKFDWKLSTSLNSQREPDQRYFFNIRTLLDDGEYLYRFDAANTQPISRFFRDLDENKNALYLNAEFPFTQWDGLASKVKVGAAFTDVERRYDQRRYDYLENRVDYADYGNPDSLFQNGVGIIDTTESRFDRWLGLTINNSNTRDSVNYFRGDMNVQAYYGMVDMPLTPWLRFIGGYRVETTELNSFSLDPTVERGRLEDVDWLPSFNLVFSLAKSMNLRLVYTNTIARPTFRELAPYVTFEYSGGFLVEGNPALQRTLIRNYDIRWEWFLQPGEIFAVSAFYKDFEDPILRFVDNTFSTDSDKFTFINATEGATVYGLELEARKRLDFISEYFQIGTNLSLVFSEQPLTDDEKTANFFAGDSSTTRPFIGQSPYLFNLNFTYDNWESKTSAGIFYNIFGDRLFAVSRQGTPDIYERAYGTLDFKMSQGFGEHLTASFSVKNILDPEKKFSYRLDNGLVDKEFLYSSYKAGTSFGVSLAYKL
jgi:TonB-dependent receptor